MATKSANLYARIEPDLKEQAESILNSLGIPASNAITMFYKQIVLQHGLPFDVKLPTYEAPLAYGSLTKEQFDEEMGKGYADVLAGNTKNAEDVFTKLHKDYSI